MVIDTPGVYALDFEDYLRDPVPGGSLSTSGAKTILDASPATFAWEREHPRPPKDTFDLGHAAHCAVLGDGMEIAVIPEGLLGSNGATSTNAAKKFIAEARARGAVPIKSDVAAVVQAMADALRAHPTAGKILHPDRGTPEQSLFWTDRETGVWRRARLDSLPHPAIGRMVIADYKTTASARPDLFAKSVASYSYHMQGAAYIDAVTSLGLTEDAAFLLVAQETHAPYLVSVVELSVPALRIGAERNRRALEIFKRCSETGHWPGYSTGIELIDLPVYAERQHEQQMLDMEDFAA